MHCVEYIKDNNAIDSRWCVVVGAMVREDFPRLLKVKRSRAIDTHTPHIINTKASLFPQ